MFTIEDKKLVRSISVYRFLAMVIVLYYHLVQIPTYSNSVINVINGTLDNLITPNNIFAPIGLTILNRFHMDTGSLAVVMFFIASGYLTSKMMDRYTRREYLVNRAISTFPTLWVSIVVVAIFVYLSQGITFTAADFLGSALPFLPRSSGTFISAVLWTMRVEIKFYLLAAVFGKNRRGLVFYGYALILLSAIVYYEFQASWLYPQMLDLSFMCFAFLGVLIECIEREKIANGMKYIVACVLFNILLFKISVWFFQDGGVRMTYPNCVTQILPVILFLLLIKLEKYMPALYDKIPRFVYSSGKLLLPIYVTHVGCGITVMYQMSIAGCNVYLILLSGFVSSFVVAGIIYLLVTKPSGIWMKKAIAAMRNRVSKNENQ